MGYFSNGTEGALYEAKYCSGCRHNTDEGCPVMLVHLLHAYSECNKGSAAEEILNLLIPRKPGGLNDKCTMHSPTEDRTSP